MVEINEIANRKSLQAWLEALPRTTEAEEQQAHRWAITIAHRAAMRVLPQAWEWCLSRNARNRHLTAVPFLRSNLICGVAGNLPTPQIMADAAADAAARAAADAAVWEAIRADCAALVAGQPLDRIKLWHDEPNPLADLWSALRPQILDQGDGWQFWVDWYDKALNGDPQDWDLLTKIALIEPKDWDNPDPNHINGIIARLVVQHAADTRPMGEDAIELGEDGLWHRTPRRDMPPDLLQDVHDRVLDTVADLRERMKSTNSLAALAPDLDRLERVLLKYPDRPLHWHDRFLQVQLHIADNLQTGELSDEHEVQDLLMDLGSAVVDIRQGSPETDAVISKRADYRAEHATAQDRAQLGTVAQAAASLSDPDLAEEFIEDAETIGDETLPPSEKAGPIYRLSGRLANMAVKDGGNVIAALEKMGSVATGLRELVNLIVLLLIFLL